MNKQRKSLQFDNKWSYLVETKVERVASEYLYEGCARMFGVGITGMNPRASPGS